MAEILFESYYGISQLGEPYLMHSGRKGMRWGVRRWQYEDGSLTPEGYIHYGYGKGRRKRSGNEKSTEIKSKKKSIFSKLFKKSSSVEKQSEANTNAYTNSNGSLTERGMKELVLDKLEVKDTRGMMSVQEARKKGFIDVFNTSFDIDIDAFPADPLKKAWIKSAKDLKTVQSAIESFENEYWNDLTLRKKYATKSAEEQWPHAKQLGWKDDEHDDWVNMFVYEDFDQGKRTGFDIWLEDTKQTKSYKTLEAQEWKLTDDESNNRKAYVNQLLGDNAKKRIKTHEKAWDSQKGYISCYGEKDLDTELSNALYFKVFRSGEENLEHSDDDYLMHSGQKGMRWGVRRWQYEDGSLTPEGYIHYGYGKKDKKKAEKEAKLRAKAEAKAEKKKNKIVQKGSASTVSKHLNELSKDEIQQAYDRLNWEKKLKDLEPKEQHKSLVKSMTDKINTANNFVTAINNFKKSAEKFSKDYLSDVDSDDKGKNKGEGKKNKNKNNQNENLSPEEAAKKALMDELDKKFNSQMSQQFDSILKDVRENTSGSSADVTRAMQIAKNKFMKDLGKAQGEKSTKLEEFGEKLAKQQERKDKADQERAEKEQLKADKKQEQENAEKYSMAFKHLNWAAKETKKSWKDKEDAKKAEQAADEARRAKELADHKKEQEAAAEAKRQHDLEQWKITGKAYLHGAASMYEADEVAKKHIYEPRDSQANYDKLKDTLKVADAARKAVGGLHTSQQSGTINSLESRISAMAANIPDEPKATASAGKSIAKAIFTVAKSSPKITTLPKPSASSSSSNSDTVSKINQMFAQLDDITVDTLNSNNEELKKYWK